MKLDSLMKDLKDRALFGKLQAETRIAPCTYMPVFASDHKTYNPENIEKFISAKIPYKNEDLEFYSLNETSIDYNGFPVYRRRDLSNVVVESAVNLYNRQNRATISLVQEKTDNQDEVVDETKAFYNYRYLSAFVFVDDDDVEDILNKPTVGSSRFTAWMECNEKYGLARTLTYIEFPKKFVWKQDERHWEHKRGFSIGRVHHVPPAFNEAYNLRILLNKVRYPTCFEDIRNVDGEVCATYRDACYKRDLLDDDNEYIEAIEEASHTASGYYLRSLFSTMLITYSLSRPDDVWEKTWPCLIDGILYKQQNEKKNPGTTKDLALLEIQNFLLRNNYTLRYFPTMPFPDEDSIVASTNRFMNEELAYDTQVMTDEFQQLFISLTAEQRDVYNEMMKENDPKKGGFLCVRLWRDGENFLFLRHYRFP
ncbi:uncharacterized protein LOC143622059 [Bidens hawaiensis]|uniref:uncharacterized protein LOC143622059 n=1 Tax=Bidens hawaiensis TaxID=980011 RepID=UPI004049B4E5